MALHRTNVVRRKQQEERAGRPCPDKCEVCGGPPRKKQTRLHFDHDHVTLQFRGWLCGDCNTVLGMVRDDPLRLEALAKYLRGAG